jgi:hypothetical protein
VFAQKVVGGGMRILGKNKEIIKLNICYFVIQKINIIYAK